MSKLVYKALDIYTLPLSGTQLVEASAGTGKTWTISGLFVRLLLETDAKLEQLLVVTFTKAATAELRDRLRTRLVDVQQALLSGQHDDPFCQWAISRFQGNACQAAIKKIEESLRIFDESAIYTIHGFCQRVLGEAQLPEMLVEPEISPNESEWLPALVQESWIKHCNTPVLANLMAEDNIDCAVIQQDAKLVRLKPGIKLEGADESDINTYIKAKAALTKKWDKQKDEIKKDIAESKGLKREKDKYKLDNLPHLLSALDGWLNERSGFHKNIRLLTPASFQANAKQSGDLPSHNFWEELSRCLDLSSNIVKNFRQTIVIDALQSLETYKRERGLISYQDLLGLLAKALDKDSEGSEAIADSIRQHYAAALIDEFQDTDPLQFKIFSRLFSGKRADGIQYPLYMVGDPKQAIYSFRGADIYTYLRARESSEGRFTLDTNRRSSPALVAATNAIFSQNKNPFLQSDLDFKPVNSVESDKKLYPEKSAFHCWLIGNDMPNEKGEYKPLGKERARQLSVDITVAEIVRLLQSAKKGETTIGDKALRPGDIAVLVPKHAYAVEVANALAAVNVPAVTRSQDSVFSTEEAQEMLMVLEAILVPGREGYVKAALLSSLWAYTVSQLYELINDDNQWSNKILSLIEWRDQWYRHGFMVMWEKWLASEKVFDRLLSGRDGERRLTNLRHLASLIQHQAELSPEPERLLAWLRTQVHEAESNEDTQLRLESDAERVQILTIHVSKGLEYPVVFCPYLWDGALLQNHDKYRAEYHKGSDAVLDMGSSMFDHASNRMATERLAEKLRVLYVALTRAKYRCYGIWGHVKEFETAPFTWLMMGSEIEGDAEYPNIANELKGYNLSGLLSATEALAEKHPDSISVKHVSENDGDVVVDVDKKPSFTPIVEAITRKMPKPWWVNSFTGLSRHEAEHEGPEHDHEIDINSAPETIQIVASAKSEPEGIHAFKKGAKAGLFWHAILEDMLNHPERAIDESILLSRMREHDVDIEAEKELVVRTLGKLRDTALGSEKAVLGKVASLRTEMEFWFPVDGFDIRSLTTLPDIPNAYKGAVRKLNADKFNGFLKGFIDLIYCHAGKYYVMDYKTNWLGPDDSFYTQENMQQAMAHHHYYLQFWLYSLALHRHLSVTMPDYDFDRHFGGVRYLFIRGIESASNGLCSEQPSRALLEKLDTLMGKVDVRGAA